MKSKAYVFSGPTLAQSELAPPEDVAFMPPAAQGDVYRAALEKPLAIGIVDGYFEGQASIWHKEILWAMDQGIHVFGSASMGALRAAELHPFGMQGIGRIFEAYRDGDLEDDDEVAVLHAPADAGFLQLSEPMVNIRATLDEAERQNVIDPPTSRLLAHLAKETFYQERRWPDLLAKAKSAGHVLDGFRAWLPDHRIDQKALDAASMINAMVDCLDRAAPRAPVDYHFEWTEMWDDVVKATTIEPYHHADDGEAVTGSSVLEEARLGLADIDTLQRLAMLRHLANAGQTVPMQPAGLAKNAMTAFRERRNLFRRTDLDHWLEQHHLDQDHSERLIADEAAIEEYLIDNQDRIGRHILDQLRLDGRYQELSERAHAKQSFLQSIGQTDPGPAGFPLSPPELRAWYFQQRQAPLPDDLDHHTRSLGFQDRQSFDRALRREYLYVTSLQR